MNDFEEHRLDGGDPQSRKSTTPRAQDLPTARTVDDHTVHEQPLLDAHHIDSQLIPGLQMGHGAMTVRAWEPHKPAVGWTLTGADLTLDQGRPFGALWYRHDDERIARVGIRWNHDVEQLESLCLHPRLPLIAEHVEPSEAANLERDARSRIGTLLAIHAEIGSHVASSRASENAILAASGLGLKRL